MVVGLEIRVRLCQTADFNPRQTANARSWRRGVTWPPSTLEEVGPKELAFLFDATSL